MGCTQIVRYSDAYAAGNEGGREEREGRMSGEAGREEDEGR